MLSISVKALIWLVSLRTLSTALDPTLEGTWRDWKATHGKEYALEEESFRRAVWEDNLKMIEDHNKQADLGKYTYWLGMNHFGDLTNEELDNRLRCLFSDFDNVTKGNGIMFKSSDDPDIPDQVDWRIKGAVTEVKDQGDCGSCWSFGATGALEGMHFLKTGELVSLSEQNLIDCSGELGNKGCNGGFMHLAFESVQKRGGIDSEKFYPYDGKVGICRYDPEKSVTRCSSFGQIQNGDEKGLQEAVAKIGPVSVGVDARSTKFRFYKSGIFVSSFKGVKQITHAMLIVGYNNSKADSGYWILKNSWSNIWGEKGYMRLAKGSNQCKVASYGVFPIPDPEKGMESSLSA
ncbi:cathepsin L1 [Protobothrops mucrosquamatus]|uniref:cathepsin L1 n=1 Tax=Protobothrops mucrosquamatus TaxID=103944 RepID=UPI000775E7C6|nr:cathepsin L1 [Protobothrops mucrosquamatus]